MKCGTELEKVYRKQELFTCFLCLIPLALYLIKYLLDTYIFPREGIRERMVNMLLDRMVQNGEDSMEGILGVMRTVLPLMEEKGAIGLGVNLAIAFVFFGWLYFLYVVAVRKIRKGSMIRNLGRCAQQQFYGFALDEPWKGAATDSLRELSMSIQNQYRQNYEFLNQKLAIAPLKEISEEPDPLSLFLEECQSWGG